MKFLNEEWTHNGCKVIETAVIETYTCQKCSSEFKSAFTDRRITPSIYPICPLCISKFYRAKI
jgi:hypothetical protein